MSQDEELDRAIEAAKRAMGVERTTAGELEAHLPEHLRSAFWDRAIERYIEQEGLADA